MKQRREPPDYDRTSQPSNQAIAMAVQLLVDWIMQTVSVEKSSDTIVEDATQETVSSTDQQTDISH